MKLKRLTALLLAAAMAFSTAVTALPAYAEGEGGAASSQSAPDADSTPGGPVGDGEPNSGPSGDPVNGNTPGEPNGNTPGDPNSDPANGTEPGAPDSDANGGPSGTPAGGSTPDNTNNDPNGDPAGDPNSDPAGDPTGDPGTQQGEACTCTTLCTSADAKDTTCSVCNEDYAKCAFEQVTVQFSFQNGTASYVSCNQQVTLQIHASMASKWIEKVTVKIRLSQQEAELIQYSAADGMQTEAAADGSGDVILSFTITPEQGGGGEGGDTKSLTVKPKEGVDFATLQITGDDVEIVTKPENALEKSQITIQTPTNTLTFVKKLPGDNDYGSGVAFETTVAPLTVTYVDSEGKPAAIQQDPPEYKLYYQVDGMDEPRCIQDLVELPFGLENEDIPTVTTTAGDSTWTGKVEDASKLPSQVLVKTGDGGYKAVPVTWTLVPSYAELYEDAKLVQITEDNKGDYPAGLKVDNWYYIAAPEPYPDDTVTVETYLDSLTHTLYWADNLGADSKRPAPEDAASLYELQFAFDGSSDYQTLTAETLKTLGLEEMPAPAVADNGASWTLTWKDSLPQTLTYTDSTGASQEEQTRTVSWRVTPKNELADYTLVEVTDENKEHYTSVTQTGPYYVLNSTMTFTVRLNRGGDKDVGAGRQEAFFEQFYLDAMYGEKHQRGQLDYLEELGLITLVPEEGAADNPDVIEITVTGLWRYNLDSSRITYTIQEGKVDESGNFIEGDTPDGRLDGVGGVPQGDWLAISYDNSAVPNYGDAVDKVYDGGTINLTLTGETSYTATKNWLDGAAQGRPDAVVELWRYRTGQSYTTAAPVRDSKGGVLTFPLSKESEGENTCTITFGTDNDPLPKYDAEGYPYLYVAREYLTGEYAPNYEQVLGAVDPETGAVTDTLPDGVTRESGDTYLYPGGTLSNRLRGTVPVAVTKDWKAASFQSEFEGVMVRLRLQSRPKTEGGQQEAWANTKTTYDMAGFYAENLTQTYTGNFDQYDAQGQELEYRWVEEAVYQDTNGDGEYAEEEKVASSVQDDGTRTFTLTQSGRTVTYRSKVEVIPADEATGDPACTKITNTIANTIDYAIQKEFTNPDYETGLAEGKYQDHYTFTLFQSVSGSVPKRYLSFTVSKGGDGDANLIWHVDEKDQAATVKAEQDAEWHATVTGLPEYDADGQLYEYLLMEQDGTPLNMTFQIDENGDYTATVINSPGGPNIILVRKEWIDESDSQHREPVTVAVYDREANEPVQYNGRDVTVTLGSRSAGVANGWYAFVAIGEYEPDDVYVLETQVGDKDVPVPKDDDGKQTRPTFTGKDETDPTAIEYSTDNHKYAVTYSYEANFGKEEGGDAGYQGCACYTVTNRRLGNIDLTVTKTWYDGDGEARIKLVEALEEAKLDLAVQLSIQSEPSLGQKYTITTDGYGKDDEGDTVTIAPGMDVPIYSAYDETTQTYTTPADSIQPLELKVESGSTDTQELHFYGLPKYDGNGAAVRYTVDEVFVNANGAVVKGLSDYPAVQAAWQEYRKTVTENDYVVDSQHRDRDKQSFDVANRLGGTKQVSWYALWQDKYAYESGNRPDVFLNIYRTVHVKGDDGKIVEKTEAAILNYRWENGQEEGVDPATFWQCIVDNLPKYDEYGYEIKYYAEMQALVTAEDFYYLPTRYAADKDGAGESVFGNEDDGVTDGSKFPAGSEEDYILSRETVDEGEVQPGHAWLLRAGNTFVNTIQGAVTYQGEKVWANLPNAYPDDDLPTVTFALGRQVGDDTTTKEERVATMTITHEQWAALAASGVRQHTFTFTHTGKNEPTKDGAGEEVPEGQTPLPRFDKLGRLYTYTLQEAEVEFDGEGVDKTEKAQNVEDVFELSPQGATVTNTYAPDTGVLTAKKYLTVPVDAAAYPAITLRLTRTYTQNDGETSAPETVPLQSSISVWSAAEVKAAVEEAKEQDGEEAATVTVEHIFPFEELPLYAPNGSPYVYTITEDKSQLNGYDTWAAKDDVTAEDLEVGTYKKDFVGDLTPRKASADPDTAVDASFLNKQADPEPITLTGTKVWEDLSNAYGFRSGELTLKLERRAPAQPGQDNYIPWKEVPSFSVGDQTCENGRFTIQADPDAEGETANTWSYTVTGLERYAPNGKTWEYRVTEKAPSQDNVTYTPTPADGIAGQQKVDPETGDITMHELKNSILTEISFRKEWVDSDGKPITQDVLGGGIELEVTFQVQVYTTRPGIGDGQWNSVGEYFSSETATAHQMKGYQDTVSIRAPLGDEAWDETHTFENLPLYIQDDYGAIYQAKYRVVETAVKIYKAGSDEVLKMINYNASSEQGDTLTYTVDEGSPVQPYYTNGKNQSITDPVHKNQLQTVSLTAQKVWQNDNPTVYATRPAFNGDRYDWQTTLVVERSTDGVHWEEIPAASRETVYGTNAENTSNTVTFSGLPAVTFDGQGNLQTYQYRVREVNTDAGQTVLKNDNETFHSGYTVTYTAAAGTTPHTVTNTLQTTTITAQKVWNDGKDDDIRPASITLELQYLKAGGNAQTEVDWLPFAPRATVTLDGSKDTGADALFYYESDAWTAVWEEVPVTMPGSAVDDEGRTLYRVTENVDDSKYIVEYTATADAFTITNTPSVTPSVQKTWLGVTQAEVTVQLQRAVEGGEPQNVPGGEVKLNAGNNWKHTFDPQPKYDADGNLYTYTVVETKVGGQDAQDAAKEGDFGISYGRSPSDDYELYVYNYKLGALQIVKDWADVDDVENRPKDLELTVERTTDQNPSDTTQWEKVEGLTWTWTKNGQNDAQWTITFDDLPLYDVATGDPYTYRVREETVPEGYVCEEIECDKPLVFHFKNTRHELISIPVQKYWVDNNDHFGWRKPVTVELYANDEATGQTLTLGPSIAETIANFFTGGDAGWGGEFTDLPKYDADGRIIQYTIVETTDLAHYGDPVYNPVDDTLTVTNTANGELTVRKTVLGNGTDPGAAFHFTVTLDEALDGTYGDMTFTGGVAEFTLQNGQSKTAGDLPAGTAYTVTEAEAGKGAYITTSTGASGRIEPGATVEAAFTNDLRRISVPVTKRWEDDNDRLGIRPASITVKLRADGADTGKTLTLNSENGWSGSFAGLPEYENGQKIAYTVEEVQVRGYATQITGDAGGYLIVNRLLPSEGGAPQDPAPTAAPAQIIPQTGDDLPVGLLAGLAIAAAGALAVLLALRKRRGRK